MRLPLIWLRYDIYGYDMAYLTDKELLERFRYYILQVEKRLVEGKDFKTLIDEIPCMVLLSRTKALEIEYTNKRHQELTGYSLKEVRAECPRYLNEIVHPSSLENVRKFLPKFYERKEQHKTLSFVQYVQLNGDNNYTPLVTITKSPRQSDGLVIRLPIQLEEFGKLSTKMEQVVEMDQFKLKHFKKFHQLTEREVEIMKLLANGCNNPEIAERLFISRSTVETHRKNLKRKLNLQSFRDLMKYAFAFNLVEV